jgi:hypothetical protein
MSCLISGRKPCGESLHDDGLSCTTYGIVNRASPVESLIVDARADPLNGQNARRDALLCDRTSGFRARCQKNWVLQDSLKTQRAARNATVLVNVLVF